ncbi:hypothetical protein RUM43_010529 [Polyplax serrata]|uniref:Choline transporter-like protein n=1 Tax=Polyplax serrata TaxID=468196 RepID=A0AAN8SA02_POLSC
MTRTRDNASYNTDKYEDSDVESINCCQLNVHKAKIRESRSKYHNYPEKRLFRRRSCTDLLCLLLFGACLAAWIYLGYYALTSTPPGEILIPTDSNNRRCGFDEEVKHMPYVFHFDLLKCISPKASVFRCDTPRVCVAECPKENFYLKFYLQTSGINAIRKKLICKTEFNKMNVYDKASAIRAVENNDCAEWYLESKPIGYRCLPKSVRNTGEEIKVGFENFGKTIESTINGVTGKELFDASKAMSDLYEFGHAVFEDLRVIWPWILIHICIAAIISFFYITIMRWISGLMVWVSILASVGLLCYSSYYTWFKFQEISRQEPANYGPPDLQNTILGLLWKKETWLTFFVLSLVVLVIIVVTITFLRTRITLAIEMIKEGSKAVISSWSAVIFPVFPWIIQLASVAYAILIFAYLINSGIPIRRVVGLNETSGCKCENNYKEGSHCDERTFEKYCHTINSNRPCSLARCLYSESETQRQALYLQLYNLLMVLWSLFFASGFGQMVLASTFATYYWTFNKDNLPVMMVASGVWKVMRYHLGTVSFGSLLLALCNWLRVIIEFVYNYLNKYDNNFVKCLKCCCSCVFWCLNAFLKFLNKNAYVMCAIHGKNFCNSARLAFNLLTRNILRVVILDRVTNFLFFLGKLMVTTALGLIAFYFFSNPVPSINDPLNTSSRYQVQYYFVPIIIVCIAAYFISSLFFGVYSMAVDTLFLCALEDLETNDGSPERPFFMSKNLMKILKKKNEIKVT